MRLTDYVYRCLSVSDEEELQLEDYYDEDKEAMSTTFYSQLINEGVPLTVTAQVAKLIANAFTQESLSVWSRTNTKVIRLLAPYIVERKLAESNFSRWEANRWKT